MKMKEELKSVNTFAVPGQKAARALGVSEYSVWEAVRRRPVRGGENRRAKARQSAIASAAGRRRRRLIMGNRPAIVTQADVTRIVRGAGKAGSPVRRIVARPDGSVVFETEDGPQIDGQLTSLLAPTIDGRRRPVL